MRSWNDPLMVDGTSIGPRAAGWGWGAACAALDVDVDSEVGCGAGTGCSGRERLAGRAWNGGTEGPIVCRGDGAGAVRDGVDVDVDVDVDAASAAKTGRPGLGGGTGRAPRASVPEVDEVSVDVATDGLARAWCAGDGSAVDEALEPSRPIDCTPGRAGVCCWLCGCPGRG